MNHFISQFILGFLCTLSFFAICVFLVATVKLIIVYVKGIFSISLPKSIPTKTPVKKRKTTRKKTPSNPPVIRSLEIDAKEVDRIYFKKSS